ncbi:MAG: GTPase ObgE [Candidatus Omnitrophica bacterium]|nr:GTPase ObgE [Candidatus Omnitrophota bacterium]
MWFVDQAQIIVKAGDGGRGCSSFAQPPYIRYPYPDGGDGGDGGDVVFVADPNIATLLDFHFRHEFTAGRGRHGGSNTKTGKRGNDLVIRVPLGTVVHDADAGVALRDVTQPGERVVVARGGRGGFGNGARTAAGTRVPEATPGAPGECRHLTLELKLIADAGLIGVPNAGKSSLLARISTAKPKIAAYPFTTRYPVLGVVRIDASASFVACDIPGLIEGAHEGKGLGFQFLRHIERTKLLVHVVDAAAVDGRDPVDAFHQLNAELAAYNEIVARRPQMVAANKMDLPQAREHLARLRKAVPQPVWPISCATGAGIPEFVQAMWKELRNGERVSAFAR